MVLKFGNTKLRNQNIYNKEVNMSEFIPYHVFYDNNTVMTKDNLIIKVIKLDGFSFETADDEDVDIRKNVRNQLFRGMGSGSIGLYFHLIRRKQDDDMSNFSSTRLPNSFADDLNQRWTKKSLGNKAFINELYITIVKKFNNKGLASFEHMINKFSEIASKDNKWKHIKDSATELTEITNRMVASLKAYNPIVLGVNKTDNGSHSDMLSFFGKIINCCYDTKMLIPNANIDKYLSSQRLYFGEKSIEIVGSCRSKYAGIISLKEYGQNTSAGMLDSFLQLPYELIVTQSYQFTDRQVAINKMQLQQNRMIQSEDKAISQIAEISRALDDAMSGRIAFGEHHLTVMCMEDNIVSLENALSIVEAELINCGLYVCREKVNMEPAFWAQLPGNFNYIVRKAVVNTLNLSGFVSLHNYPVGKRNNNHWGEAITLLETTSGTPYYFNFHQRDVGHTTIIGPTGSGKTVLMNFLCAQAIKVNPRIFFFDKDRGGEIFIRALGGRYSIIESRKSSGFNPLQLDDTSDNRNFLSEWLKLLLTAEGEVLSSADIAIIEEAIDGNYKLDKKDRILRNIAAFMGLEGPETLAGRLKSWHGDGSHAALFDNEEDNINFYCANVFGFEMAHLLKDAKALSPVLLYLFHRINSSLDGTPTIIVLDEAWALIDNKVFAPKIKDWLKVLRKLNAMVIFATQSVEDASKSDISDTLIQQTATQIFLPNMKATNIYKQVFMLSDREFVIVKHTDAEGRYFLIKQGMNSTVARVDLSGMSDIIDILSGRAETVILLDKIRNEIGDDPHAWMPIFLEEVKNV